jgi:CRP/FNR family transcriptional regulator
VLRDTPVFAALPERELAALAAVARRDTVPSKRWIFAEGDPADWLCLVVCGRVKIVKHAHTGKEITVELLGPGEIFGGVAVIERRPYPASAQAMEASEIARLPGRLIITLAERYPSVIREMALMMGRRLRTAHSSVTSLAAEPVEARLASTILRLADREGERTAHGLVLPFHLTRQALADLAGTTVETTIRVMRRWIRDGLVSDRGGRLVLPKVDAVRTLAAGQRSSSATV